MLGTNVRAADSLSGRVVCRGRKYSNYARLDGQMLTHQATDGRVSILRAGIRQPFLPLAGWPLVFRHYNSLAISAANREVKVRLSLILALAAWFAAIPTFSSVNAQWDETAAYPNDFFAGDFGVFDEQAQEDFFTRGKRRHLGRREAAPAGWVAGADATWFRPSLSSLSPFAVSVTSPNGNYYADSSPANLREFDPGGRLWLGWQTHETGWLGRYSRFDSSAGRSFVDPTEPMHAVFTRQDLEFSAWDIEWHRRWWSGPQRLDVGLGLRFADIEHIADLQLAARFDDRVAMGTARSVREARGIGPVLSADAWRPIGDGTRWAWFWSTRSAALFGRQSSTAEVLALADDGTIVAEHNLQQHETDNLLWIAEAELGVFWFYRLPGSRLAAIRVAADYQYWATWTDNAPASADVGTGQTAASVEVGNSPLRLSAMGLAVGVHIVY
ncbi:MAG: hypothetical protein KatS3mg110_1881 [Pirellulaceae bacterium]|nr:MAG: hypothetical protein KatS3mg110_1881 [Pirellulaceae bacterium]